MAGIVGLGGGIGASRLWRALLQFVSPLDLTLVVNTGDDLWMHGLRVCPDLDTTLYALSDRQDTERGWGRRGESWQCMGALRELGTDVWFNLGDLDLATHLRRTTMLSLGAGLGEVTTAIAKAFGVTATVLPMSEDHVTTYVDTYAHGPVHYEEYLVRYEAQPAVRAVAHRGAEHASPTPGVLDAIAEADVVVLAPSNPVATIGPILAVPGVREALRGTRAPVIAISPIVAGRTITEPGEVRRATSRAALMRSVGVPADPAGVAGMYADLCNAFVLDTADKQYVPAVRSHGVGVAIAPILPHTGASPRQLVDLITEARVSR